MEEAILAVNNGANAIGLVGQMPSGPGIIGDDLICEIALEMKGIVDTFLLTSETSARDIISHAQRTGTNTLQLVDRVTVRDLKDIKAALPDVHIIQVVHVHGDESLKEARLVQSWVDAILLDSGNPKLAIRTLGGTGNTHNWNISRQIVDEVDIPVYLAGGIKKENVQEAIKIVQPFGIDLCSGVRVHDNLDAIKLKDFMKQVQEF